MVKGRDTGNNSCHSNCHSTEKGMMVLCIADYYNLSQDTCSCFPPNSDNVTWHIVTIYKAGLDFNTSVPKGKRRNKLEIYPPSLHLSDFSVLSQTSTHGLISQSQIFSSPAFHMVYIITKQHLEILTTATNSSEGRWVVSPSSVLALH